MLTRTEASAAAAPATVGPVVAPRRRSAPGAALPVLQGAIAMALVGGSVAISGVLEDAPMHTAQALRYAAACALLLGGRALVGSAVVRGAVARASRRPTGPDTTGGGRGSSITSTAAGPAGVRLHRPAGREWLWLIGVALSGLVLFNIALVEGSAHAEPAVLAVAVASVPIVLGVVGPLLEGSRPGTRALVAAAVVTAGAALVQGFGRSDGAGLLWALLVLGCEAGFTLLAVPVLRRHGPFGVSVWATAIATGVFGVLGVALEGPTAVLRLQADHLLATAYLAVAVTALAFVLWYGAVQRLGSARAGLLTGVAPVSAALVGAAVAGALPAAAVWLGLVLVVAGLGTGLTARRGSRDRRADGAGRASEGVVAPAWQDRGAPVADATIDDEGARPCPERTSPAPRRPSAPPSSARTATRSSST